MLLDDFAQRVGGVRLIARRSRVSALEDPGRSNRAAAGDLLQKRVGVLSPFLTAAGAALKNCAQPLPMRHARALCFLEQLIEEAQIGFALARL